MKIKNPKLARKDANFRAPWNKLLVVLGALGPWAIYECHHPKEVIMGWTKICV